MNILIVSPAFPPYSGVASMRAYSLANYLKNKGNAVYIIRNSKDYWGAENCKSPCNDFESIIDVDVSGEFSSSSLEYTNAIKRLIQKKAIDIAVYSCSPYYIVKSAIKIKKEYGIKTIIDYRDLWINDEPLTRNILKRFKKVLVKMPYRRFEAESIEIANAILTVTPRDCDYLQKKYKKYKYKIKYIYNGFEEDRLSNVGDIDISHINLPQYYIGIFGKFGYYDFKYAVAFLNAVKIINDEGFPLKLVHVGKKDITTDKAIIASHISNDIYINTGYQDYSTGMKIISNSLLNCLIVHYKRALGTKVFDYIYARRPIVSFAQKDSAIQEILSNIGNAFRCESTDEAVNAIHIIKENLPDFLSNNNDIDQFSRKHSNEQYLKLIKQIVEEGC